MSKRSVVEEYYINNLLNENDKKLILSDDPVIIDLNKNPEQFSPHNSASTIYKITTEFAFDRRFIPATRGTEIILQFNACSVNLTGVTDGSDWIDQRKQNLMCFHLKATCTAWFRLVPSTNGCDAEFLMIGDIVSVTARELVSETCDLLDMIAAIHNEVHTNPDEILNSIVKIIDTADKNLEELSQPEMIEQYDPNDRDDYLNHIAELRAAVDVHRKFIQSTKDARWMERKGVV